MNLKILGSGGWNGIPAPFCGCNVCKSTQTGVSNKNNRTRPELLIGSKNAKFLIEISPDIRIQLSKFKIYECTDFLVSHWHFDHLYGLYELHEWAEAKKLKIYCSTKTASHIESRFNHINKEIEQLKPFSSFELNGIHITPIPVYHMRKEDETLSEYELNNTFGFVLEEHGVKITYLSDYYKLGSKATAMAKESDLLIADGTYLFGDNLIKNYPHLKDDNNHLHGEAIIDFVKTLKPKKTIFHSITHLTHMKHDELQRMLPKNMYISFDGMTVRL